VKGAVAVLIPPNCPAEGAFGVESVPPGRRDYAEQQFTELLLGRRDGRRDGGCCGGGCCG
jgi:hypothetical protein